MRWLVALTFVSLAGAGCTAPPASTAMAHDEAPADSAPTVAPPLRIEYQLLDCQFMTWSLPVLASRLAPHMPSGFEPESSQLPAGTEQAASLVFEALECAAGLGRETAALRSVQFGRIYTPVLPPSDLRTNGARHTYSFQVMAGPDDWRRTAQDAGWPVFDGGAMVGASAQGWSGALALDTIGTFTVSGRTTDGEAAVADTAMRAFTASPNGLQEWAATLTQQTSATGIGTWEASADSWVAQVTGATQGLATFQLGFVSIPDGRIGPVQRPSEEVDGHGPWVAAAAA